MTCQCNKYQSKGYCYHTYPHEDHTDHPLNYRTPAKHTPRAIVRMRRWVKEQEKDDTKDR